MALISEIPLRIAIGLYELADNLSDLDPADAARPQQRFGGISIIQVDHAHQYHNDHSVSHSNQIDTEFGILDLTIVPHDALGTHGSAEDKVCLAAATSVGTVAFFTVSREHAAMRHVSSLQVGEGAEVITQLQW